MESTTSSRRNYQINFFKPQTAFLKDNVRIIISQYHQLGCSCVLLSSLVEGD